MWPPTVPSTPSTPTRTSYRRFLHDLATLLRRRRIAPSSPPRASADEDVSTNPLIGYVQTYIDTHPGADLSLERLSEEARLSKYHFARLFKEETGQTPWAYVLKARMRRAKKLLATTDRSLAEIALRTGFFDQSHFTRTFKRLEGTTPGTYRDEHADDSATDAFEA